MSRMIVPVAVLGMLTSGCQLGYFAAMELIGYHKRDLLVGLVEAARDSQEEAKEQFRSALEQFTSVVEVDGGELEDQYAKLRDELEASQEQAADVRERIQSVEDVGEALFDEWEAELDQYSSSKLRQQSAAKLSETRRHYDTMIAAMHRAEAKMGPVLAAFNDQVLFLKHNLNAKAVASLEGELASVETDIAALIREMEVSIAEANEFLETVDES